MLFAKNLGKMLSLKVNLPHATAAATSNIAVKAVTFKEKCIKSRTYFTANGHFAFMR